MLKLILESLDLIEKDKAKFIAQNDRMKQHMQKK